MPRRPFEVYAPCKLPAVKGGTFEVGCAPVCEMPEINTPPSLVPVVGPPEGYDETYDVCVPFDIHPVVNCSVRPAITVPSGVPAVRVGAQPVLDDCRVDLNVGIDIPALNPVSRIKFDENINEPTVDLDWVTDVNAAAFEADTFHSSDDGDGSGVAARRGGLRLSMTFPASVCSCPEAVLAKITSINEFGVCGLTCYPEYPDLDTDVFTATGYIPTIAYGLLPIVNRTVLVHRTGLNIIGGN